MLQRMGPDPVIEQGSQLEEGRRHDLDIDGDSNPTCSLHSPLQAAINGSFGSTARPETAHGGLRFALNLP